MERITRTDLAVRAARVSNWLRGDLTVETQSRNGHVALDLYDKTGCVRTLTVGTKREVHEYLDAMMETLTIVGRDAS